MASAADRSFQRIGLKVSADYACPYLPDRLARIEAFDADELPADVYQRLMDQRFRRNGRLFYRPVCRSCSACMPIRVPVEGFTPSKSQRRTWRRNADLVASVGQPMPTDEKYDLFQRYQVEWHQGQMNDGPEAFRQFLYESAVPSIEIEYRDPAGRLLGVGICDIGSGFLSSVYFYFDPDESRRGLGVFSILYEMEYARNNGIPHYYLGYWIAGCGTMAYKNQYRPYELLNAGGRWEKCGAQSCTNF